MHSNELVFNLIAFLSIYYNLMAIVQTASTLSPSQCPQLKCAASEKGICAKSANKYRTFSSVCEMRNFNCLNRENYHVVDGRFCGRPTCPTNGPKVCACDGKKFVLFDNECSMELFNCQFEREFVRAQNQSACLPHSNCPAPCYDEYSPMCVRRDDNIQLFTGKCYLNYHNCEFGDNYCLTDISECSEGNLTQGDIDQSDQCPDVCPAVYDPVCGRDNSNRYREFSNGCVMGIHNCENPLNRYELVNLTFCRNDCDKRVCSNLAGDFCITDGLENIRVNSLCDIERLKCKTGRDYQMAPHTHCHCPAIACTKEYAPICATCGTAVQTYSNLCQLSAITCNYTKNVVPIDQSFCLSPTELCPNEKQCLKQYYPICTEITGNRFELVDSPCKLRWKNCNGDKRNVFKVVNINMCQTKVPSKCRSRMCTSYQYKPVCASNAPGTFKWFGNRCSLDLFNCNQSEGNREFYPTPIRFCSDIIGINVL